MALGDIFRVDYEMLNDDKVVQTSLHYEEIVVRDGTQAEVTAAIAADSEVNFWTNFWQLFASLQMSYRQTVCQQIFPSRQAPAISVLLAGQVGAGTSDAMNGTTAVVVGLYGQAWSANFRGRGFLPGIGEASVDIGRIQQTTIDIIQPAATVFYEASLTPSLPAGGGFLPVVFSPTRATPPATMPVSDIIQIATVRPRIGTQRKRRTPVVAPSP